MSTIKRALWAAFICAFPADYPAAWFLFWNIKSLRR